MERPYTPLSYWLIQTPDQPLLYHQGRTLTTKEVLHHVYALYVGLTAHSAQTCALFFHDKAYFIIALLAVLHAGKTPLLLGHHKRELLTAQPCDYDLLLTDDKNVTLPNSWYTPNDDVHAHHNIALPTISGDTQLIFFTSGSSGTPKRIAKCVKTMDLEAAWLANLWQCDFNANYIRSSVSHQHLYGMTFSVWLPLSLGYQIDCTPIEFPEQLSSQTPYIFITSPAFLQFIDCQLPQPNWSFIVSAGGTLAENVVEKLANWSSTAIHEIYGSTETGVIAHRNRANRHALWQCFPEVALFTDDHRHYTLRSPLIAPLGTLPLEDTLHMTENGHFMLQGRRDKIIKIAEKRLSTTLIEQYIAALPGIIDVAVVPVQRKTRTYLGAVVVLDSVPNQSSTRYVTHWQQQLRDKLDPVAIPRFWRIVPSIPVNSQSKRSWPLLQELFDVTD